MVVVGAVEVEEEEEVEVEVVGGGWRIRTRSISGTSLFGRLSNQSELSRALVLSQKLWLWGMF